MMDGPIFTGFEPERVDIALDKLLPVKAISSATRRSVKYKKIAISVKEVGIVEPLMVCPAKTERGRYLLLDGHLRAEILKEQGKTIAPCLISKDDEAFTYNKRINRLASIQEHNMICEAVKNGVSEEKIAKALGVSVKSILQKKKLLDGICPEVVEILKDRHFPIGTIKVLKRMKPLRQIAVVETMVSVSCFTHTYAKALLVGTHPKQLKEPKKRKPLGILSSAERERMEQEVAQLHHDMEAVEEDFGTNMLTLVVANGYLERLLDNERVSSYLLQHYGELYTQIKGLNENISADLGG
ncbi:MAG: ParB N-terminal domain-containing protein [Kordiimonadaceae bacterium]|nr:ParB N-terminal domain-containing protein [Kordiimonadaceae bacterium]